MPITIQVFFDYVCPFCYLGEVPLKNAVVRTGAEVVHRAFQLRESGPSRFDPIAVLSPLSFLSTLSSLQSAPSRQSPK